MLERPGVPRRRSRRAPGARCSENIANVRECSRMFAMLRRTSEGLPEHSRTFRRLWAARGIGRMASKTRREWKCVEERLRRSSPNHPRRITECRTHFWEVRNTFADTLHSCALEWGC